MAYGVFGVIVSVTAAADPVAVGTLFAIGDDTRVALARAALFEDRRDEA
jgi:hypothetical protein